MEREKGKLKAWYGDHKELIKKEAVKTLWYLGGFGLGCYVTNMVNNAQINAGISALNSVGVIKFFDPSNGLEVNLKEAINVMNRMSE